jgi:hypothetical protein
VQKQRQSDHEAGRLAGKPQFTANCAALTATHGLREMTTSRDL